jgi:hypothetical protein
VKTSLPLALLAALALAGNFAVAQPEAASNEPLVDRVRKSIDKGVSYLNKCKNAQGTWEQSAGNLGVEHAGGPTALALLALLNAGVKAEELGNSLTYLRKIDNPTNYVRALQTMVFIEADQLQDNERIYNNVKHLVDHAIRDNNGNLVGWGYDRNNLSSRADNSNTQYALLALWVAQQKKVDIQALWKARENGVDKDKKFDFEKKFWEQVRDFYTRTLGVDGGWGYAPDGDGGGFARGTSLTMTSAALCGLLMAQMELGAGREKLDPVAICGIYEENKALAKGFSWIYSPPPQGKDQFSITLPGRTFYNLYGLERLGRLSAMRFVGPHDWYREGCAWLVDKQQKTGAWSAAGNWDEYPVISTSFALLFLSKGRTPVLISKLVHGPWLRQNTDQDWNRRRNDLRHLVDFASTTVFNKMPLSWQNIDIVRAAQRRDGLDAAEQLREATSDMLQSPILYLTGHESPLRRLGALEEDLLKKYVENGGFILAVACCGDKNFDKGFHELCQKLWPENELTDLPLDDPIWNMHFEVKPGSFGLKGIQLGCKTVVVYSPQNLCGYWEINRRKDGGGDGETAFRLGANIIAYATGLVPPPVKLTSVPVAGTAKEDPLASERGYFKVGQLISKVGEEADWKPAPEAMSKLMLYLRETVGLDVVLKTANVPITHKDLSDFKFLYMHGRKDFKFTPQQLERLRINLKTGGLLLADACCGKEAFDKAFRRFIVDLFPNDAFPPGKAPRLEDIPPQDVLFSKELNGEALTDANIQCRVKRKEKLQPMRPALEGVKIGPPGRERWVVIYSKYDIGCALAKHQSADCVGYSYESAQRLGRAAVLYQFRP